MEFTGERIKGNNLHRAKAGEMDIEINGMTTAGDIAPKSKGVSGGTRGIDRVDYLATYCLRPRGFTVVGRHLNAAKIARALKQLEQSSGTAMQGLSVTVISSGSKFHPHRFRGLGITDVMIEVRQPFRRGNAISMENSPEFQQIDSEVRRKIVEVVKHLQLTGTKLSTNHIARST